MIERLTDPSKAMSIQGAQRVPAWVPDEPGLYSWWADGEGLRQLEAVFASALPRLIYAGQAGATSTRAASPSMATLRSRIGGNHLNGNIRSSTFRFTLAAVLREPLALQPGPGGRLDASSNQELSRWIRRHLSIACLAWPERATLPALEHAVLERVDPPLNLTGMRTTALRRRLRELRRGLTSSTIDFVDPEQPDL